MTEESENNSKTKAIIISTTTNTIGGINRRHLKGQTFSFLLHPRCAVNFTESPPTLE
jgi:hypothetical protein